MGLFPWEILILFFGCAFDLQGGQQESFDSNGPKHQVEKNSMIK